MNHTTTQSYPDYMRAYRVSGERMEAIAARYTALVGALSDHLAQLNAGPQPDLRLIDDAQDRLMRLAKRVSQERLRVKAYMDAVLELRPTCSCGKLHGACNLRVRCSLCTTEVRYTLQQERELALPPAPREAALRARTHSLYVQSICQERLRSVSSHTYEPKVRRLPTRMPRLCGVGRLWSEQQCTVTA